MAMNVKVRRESIVNSHPEILRTIKAIVAVQLSPRMAAKYSMTWQGWVINPVPKSDKASPAISKFDGEWRFEE